MFYDTLEARSMFSVSTSEMASMRLDRVGGREVYSEPALVVPENRPARWHAYADSSQPAATEQRSGSTVRFSSTRIGDKSLPAPTAD